MAAGFLGLGRTSSGRRPRHDGVRVPHYHESARHFQTAIPCKKGQNPENPISIFFMECMNSVESDSSANKYAIMQISIKTTIVHAKDIWALAILLLDLYPYKFNLIRT